MKQIWPNFPRVYGSFFIYLGRLELIAFFSGYPVIYAFITVFAGKGTLRFIVPDKIVSLLPVSYALVGTLYLGFKLKAWFPDYSIENIRQSIPHPYLFLWALLSMIFWIPAIAKRKLASLIHSLVFFFLLVSDFYLLTTDPGADGYIGANDMKLYGASILINASALITTALLFYLLGWLKSKNSLPGTNR